MSLLDVKNLKIYYFTLKGVVRAVDDVSFNVREGEVLGIAGESGSGKSTLGYGLMRLVPPPGRIVGGNIVVSGRDIVSMDEGTLRREIRWKVISMIFQGALNALNPVYTIGKQLVEPIIFHEDVSLKEAYERAAEMVKLVGLNEDVLRRYPHELSGGMKQRVMIAMALILRPKIVIADEPTTALDVVIQAQIMNLFKKIKKELNQSIIFITHDLSLIAEIADNVAVMYAGKIVEYGNSDNVFNTPKHPYTQGLLKSIPRLKSKEKLSWIPGTPPDLRNPPVGCRFHPRCPYVMDVCRREEPPIKDVGGNHLVACWLY
ncbi:MAG: ABC transporter ATP-binding protein [Desulfurococcaceae archaeon]|nr:ABC transporter ATP-binding protein [Desulfurococcaceae archaeon]